MSDPDVRELFLRAVTHNDSAAMREGLERLFGLTGDGLSAEAEYRLRHEDYVMEMPQSGERIRGRDAMNRWVDHSRHSLLHAKVGGTQLAG